MPCPTSAALVSACEDSIESDRVDMEVLSCEMPSTVLSSESCDRNSLLSVGSSGSWFCSCAVMSVRKSFIVRPPTPLVELLLLSLLPPEPLVPVPLVPLRNANGLLEFGPPTPLVLMMDCYLACNWMQTQLCPIFNVASIMSREVLSTSTLF